MSIEIFNRMEKILEDPIVKEVFANPEKRAILESKEFLHTAGLLYTESFQAGSD